MLIILRDRLWSFLTSRMQIWAIVSIALGLLLVLLAPRQIPVSLYKLALVSNAAWIAYWIDRSLFPYARPDVFLPPCDRPVLTPFNSDGMVVAFAAAMLRRALIIAAAMIAVALGA